LKLLLDQNLSYRILRGLGGRFPDSNQVRQLGMETASDLEIWNYARSHGYTVVTKVLRFSRLTAGDVACLEIYR